MRYLLLIAVAFGFAGAVYAQDVSCGAAAAEKNLAGAAKKSFMRKCAANAAKVCRVTASANKLSGAAKRSFTTKCVRTKVVGK
jgi:psiF repeat